MEEVQQKEKANLSHNELCMYLSCLEKGVRIQSKGEGTGEKMISVSNIFINLNSKKGLGGKLQLAVMGWNKRLGACCKHFWFLGDQGISGWALRLRRNASMWNSGKWRYSQFVFFLRDFDLNVVFLTSQAYRALEVRHLYNTGMLPFWGLKKVLIFSPRPTPTSPGRLSHWHKEGHLIHPAGGLPADCH